MIFLFFGENVRKFINVAMLIFTVTVFSGFSSAEAWFWNKEKKAEKEYQRSNNEADKAFKELDNETEKLNNEKNDAPVNEKDDNQNDGRSSVMNVEPAYPTTNNGETPDNGSISDNVSISPVLPPEGNVIEKQSPRADIDKKRPVMCGDDYPLINGLPNWVISPSEDGYAVTAVGLGIYGNGGISGQKRAARIQAEGEISKILNVKIENELNIEKTVHVNGDEEKVSSDMQTSSRQRASEILHNAEELKCWVDPTNNDYYVLLGIPYDKMQNFQ